MRRALTVAVLAAATVINVCSSGCTASGDEPKNKAAAARDDAKGKATPPRAVGMTPAAERTLARTVSATGTLVADEQVVLGTKVAGRLAEVTVDLGSRMKRGQAVGKLDQSDFKHRVETRVAEKLEEQINAIQGIQEMRSASRPSIRTGADHRVSPPNITQEGIVFSGRCRPSVRWLIAVSGLVTALAGCPAQSAANNPFEPWANSFDHGVEFRVGLRSDTYTLNNTGATLQPFEPDEGGLLTRSIWGHLSPMWNYRVVIHTFGSEVDTVVAVYTGSAVAALTKITSNHTFPVAGLPSGGSLVQFDAVAGETYHIQIGSVGGAQGDIAVNVFQLPPGGGLSMFFAQVEGSLAVNGKDYVCTTTTCFAPTFVVHNSMDQSLDVAATTLFGPLFDAPAGFSLGPGAAAAATFHANANPDALTTRTQTGEFAFSGQVGGLEVTRASYSGTVITRGTAAQTSIVAAILPTARSGGLNQPLTAFATVINTGTQPAIGCVASVLGFFPFNVSFQETDPVTNTPIGAPRAPVNVASGAFKTFVVSVGSQGMQLGDPEFGAPVVLQCANAGSAGQNLANAFAVTSLGTLEVADMISIGATPTGDGILAVPSGTGGAFGVATVNIGVAATVTARPVYLRPFGENDPAKQFASFICETDASSQCITGLAPSVQFSAAPNAPHTFAVFVQRPATDPGFDPGQRRIVVKFEVQSPPNFFGSNPIPILVGSTSVAPRAQ